MKDTRGRFRRKTEDPGSLRTLEHTAGQALCDPVDPVSAQPRPHWPRRSFRPSSGQREHLPAGKLESFNQLQMKDASVTLALQPGSVFMQNRSDRQHRKNRFVTADERLSAHARVHGRTLIFPAAQPSPPLQTRPSPGPLASEQNGRIHVFRFRGGRVAAR